LAAAIAVLVAMEIETEDDIASRYRRIKRVSLASHLRICPLPRTTHFRLVSPSSPTGPRA
jgi:hypothetical protein